jgi:hypothetical protein
MGQKRRRKQQAATEAAKERRLDLLVSALSRAGAKLQEQGAEIILVLPLQTAIEIGALAIKRDGSVETTEKRSAGRSGADEATVKAETVFGER